MALIAFALLLTVATVGALARGGEVERRGAGLFVVAWLMTLACQWISGETSPGIWLPVIDVTVLLTLAALAWRSPRPWPVYCCGFQTLAVAGDIAKWVETDLDIGLHLTLLASLGFASVAALAMGAWFPPPPRRR